MVEIILGCIIGASFSFSISEIYYRRTSKDLKNEILHLKNENEDLKDSIRILEDMVSYLKNDTEIIRKNSVYGTPDDPQYPYK